MKWSQTKHWVAHNCEKWVAQIEDSPQRINSATNANSFVTFGFQWTWTSYPMVFLYSWSFRHLHFVCRFSRTQTEAARNRLSFIAQECSTLTSLLILVNLTSFMWQTGLWKSVCWPYYHFASAASLVPVWMQLASGFWRISGKTEPSVKQSN